MKNLIFSTLALFAFSAVAQVGTPPGGTKTIVVNAAESSIFANQKCVRAAGQAGPADTRFLRVIEGKNHKGCTVQLERAANAGPGAKSNFQDLFRSSNTKAAVAALPEEVAITFSQVGSFYDVVGAGKAIQLYNSPAVGHYFWFSVTGGANVQIAPALVGATHQVAVLPADTAAQIAVKLNTAVAAVTAAFHSSVSGAKVSVTAVTAGAATDASATGTAAALVIKQGSDAAPADWSICNKQANTEVGKLTKHAYTCANE